MKAISSISLRRALQGPVLALSLAVSATAAHASESPFSNLNGSWSGPGVITLAGGGKENMRCRGTYNVDRHGSNMSIMLRCASDSYRFELQSTVRYLNGAVSGHWKELSYGVGGTLSGNGKAGRFNAKAEGGPFAAQLAVNTRADRQSVSITSAGGPVAEVAISLSRSK